MLKLQIKRLLKLKIENLKISNFLTIGEIECSLDQKGLVLIQGENKDDSSQDSNGSGKSSFADAILWCLFGSTARGESGDKVVNRSAKKNCCVQITVSDGEDRYEITRHRKHSKEKNKLTVFKLDNESVDLTKGTDKLTQPIVNKIIGCSEEVFTAAIYAGQEAMPDLPGMTDKQLKTLIEEAAGIDRLQSAHSEALLRIRSIKTDISIKQTEIAGGENSVNDSKQSLAELKDKQKTHKEKSELRIKEINDLLSGLDEKIVKAERNCVIAAEKTAEFKKALASIQNQIDSLSEEKIKHKELIKLSNKAQSEFMNSQANFDANEKRDLANLKSKYESIEDSVGRPCESCGKPVTAEEIDSVRENIRELIVNAKHNFLQARDTLSQKSMAAEKAKSELELFESNMTDVSSEIKKSEEIRLKIEKLSEYENIKDKLIVERTNLNSELNQIKSSENPFNDLLVSAKEKLKERISNLESTKNELTDLMDKLKVGELTEKVFSPAGVRAHILDTVTPFLNQRTSEYLSVLTDENISATWSTLSQTATGDVREKFVIDVVSKVGAANFKSLSGGEKRKVRLACSMALQDLVSSRASKPIELYIADEIDHALDEAGLERLMGILDEKAKTKGTALVISHNSLSDWIRQSVTVVKENGYSALKGNL